MPFPDTGIPFAVLLLVQAKVLPGTGPPTVICGFVAVLQMLMLEIELTVGVGLTVMVKDCVGPGHPLAVGVTVMVPEILAVVGLVVVNEGMSPVPDAASPIAGLLLVQLKVVAPTVPTNGTAVVAAPLHTVCEPMAATVGIGFTVTAVVAVAEVHPSVTTYKLYVPVAAVVADIMEGSSSPEENPLGPVQK